MVDPVLAPVLAVGDELEVPAIQRVERVRHPDATVPSPGSGVVDDGGQRGDIIAVPAWTEFSLKAAASQLDLFTFSDAPVFEKLNLLRTEVSGRSRRGPR
jgi:gentisate 1,2-dioxygenase